MVQEPHVGPTCPLATANSEHCVSSIGARKFFATFYDLPRVTAYIGPHDKDSAQTARTAIYYCGVFVSDVVPGLENIRPEIIKRDQESQRDGSHIPLVESFERAQDLTRSGLNYSAIKGGIIRPNPGSHGAGGLGWPKQGRIISAARLLDKNWRRIGGTGRQCGKIQTSIPHGATVAQSRRLSGLFLVRVCAWA